MHLTWPNWGLILAGAAGCVLAAKALIVAPAQVAAMPAYARQTGLPCGQCHENAAGGRKLKNAPRSSRARCAVARSESF
jgi:hypothetical protein